MPVTKPELAQSLAEHYPLGVEGGITGQGQRDHLTLLGTAVGDLQDETAAINARLDAAIEKITTPEQKATINAISAEMGGAPGLILRVLANDAKHSFTTQDAATLAEVAARHNRSEEDILQLIADSPITAAEAAKFLAVQTDIDAINNRLDELPTPEGIPQELYDRIIALEARNDFTPAERLQIVANMNKSAENAQSILTLIDNLAAANLRIDENAALRRITPQEIADITALKARVNITQEQADKIAAADAIHADHEARIAKLELDGGGEGLDQDAVDARVNLQVNPTLITQEVVTHADITDIPVSVSPSAPAEVTTPITISDPSANPLKKDVITFTYRLEETANQGGFDPSMNFEVRQGDELLATRTLENPSELITTSFKGYLNTPFQVITRGTQNGDAGGRSWNIEITNIAGARKGKLYTELLNAIHNETDPDIQFLRGELAKIKALTDGVGGSLATISENVLGNTDDINDVRDYAHATDAKVETPAMQKLRSAILELASTVITVATELNTTLGGGSKFAEQIKDDAIGTATQFLTRFTKPTQALFYGAGQLARVINGRFIIYRLIPYQAPRVDTETRYITTDGGLGTLSDPAVLEFGAGTPRLAGDSEVFLTEGILTLAPNQTMSNISMAFAVRINGNWQTITNTIQLDLRSGESRSFSVPNVVGITFTATALANGQIRCRATHDSPDNVQQVTNGAAIRFDAGFTLTTNVAEVQRDQEAVDAGAFTGNNLIAFDARQSGDSATVTAHIITPFETYDTGYYLNDAHRLAFATDNDAFAFLISEPDTDLTPAVMAQLIGTDEYLGLFARTNHTEDAVDFGAVIIGRDSATGEKVTLSKADAGSGGGVVSGGATDDEKADIKNNKEALFGEEIVFVGDWDVNSSYVAGTKQFDALAIGDVVRQTKNGDVSYWEVVDDNFSTKTGTSAPNTPDNQADMDNRWRRKDYMIGIVEAIVLNGVSGDITLGGDPVMGGGVRYRTFFRDLPMSELQVGTKTFVIPTDASDEDVTYLTWAAAVIVPSTTASNLTLYGGDIGSSENDRGRVVLALGTLGSRGAHSFGIPRQTHGAAVRVASVSATPSADAMVRVSITISQGGQLIVPLNNG